METNYRFVFALLLLLGLSAQGARAQTTEAFYKGKVDLTKVQADRLEVSIQLGQVAEDRVVFCMPKTIPGVYRVNDFGRFISEFRAFSREGDVLAVEQVNVNRWLIKDATRLHTVRYWVEDTFDSEDTSNIVFEPSGTNIEEGKNFVINTHGFFGYLRGYDQQPYTVSFVYPPGFRGTTSLVRVGGEENEDIFIADNYRVLVDSPIMYCVPDVATFTLGRTQVEVSVYAPNERVSSRFILETIKPLLQAQKVYMGNEIPVDRYHFIFYFFEKNPRSMMSGALEHSRSSFYCLTESAEPTFLQEMIRNVAAHEFFHILTPLHIHSKEIAFFDFNEPALSQHLWLYEGVTEYFAHHVQVQAQLSSEEKFIETLAEKAAATIEFDDALPFTEMSKGVHDAYKDQYSNVYVKGALIAMCLDIILREASHGTYGLMQLVQELMAAYGEKKPFRDEALFAVIAEKTYPAIEAFLARHVAGVEPLPLQEIFDKVGFVYTPSQPGKAVAAGQFVLHEGDVVAAEPLGYVRKDELVQTMKEGGEFLNILQKVGAYDVLDGSMEELSNKLRDKYAQGKKVRCVYLNLNKNTGESSKETERCVIDKERQVTIAPTLTNKENMSREQMFLRDAWLSD